MLMDYARAIKAYGNDYGIKKAIEEKKLFRIDGGVYSTKLIVSEEAALCFRYPKAVLALSSAFYLHGLTDTTPDYYEMATSRDAAKIYDPRVRQVFSPRKILNVGKTRFQKDGTIFVYDLERCAIDLFRYKSKLPYDYYKEVLRNLRSRLGEMDVRKLQDYISKMPRQERLMRMMMEELL